ncbi:MAG: biotin--[acetyl-CoA-carboxylase] ligase [Treponema sp.]|jgi:BirA family biotin operon repressor/biotin-[acetyl-CoA-carboxylase] ligase|nr:biotin--[acetyl-CoA-carboxylase] ligase [Treponema sp.]
MVNQNLAEYTKRGISTKAGILGKLREEPGNTVSGQSLGKVLGVSRVAVWKAVRSLQNAGYPIRGDDGGYRFSGDGEGDFLYPWEFGEGEGRFRHWVSTDSTMNRARDMANRGAPGGMVFTAETQSAGRGRNGKKWTSNRGGLFFTLLERPGLGISEYTRLALAAHIALGEAISGVCGKKAELRWPNDVWIGDCKIAGLLTELSGAGDRIEWMSIGMGININNPPPRRESINCLKLLGHPVSRKDMLLRVLHTWEGLNGSAPGPRELQTRWNRAARGMGRPVLLIEPNRPAGPGEVRERGIFMGIDLSGRGLVKTPAGLKKFLPGSVSLVFD